MSRTLIRNITTVTMDDSRRIIEGAGILIEDDRIEAVGKGTDLEGANGSVDRVIDGAAMSPCPV